MIKNKCKKIVSAMLLMTMIATTFSVDVFAGGDNSDCISDICESCTNGCLKGCLKCCIDMGCCPCIPYPITDDDDYDFNKKTKELTLLSTYSKMGPIPQYTNEIQTVTIERGVKRLVGTFQNCYNLTTVTISDTVKEIGENAFADCKDLESVKIPASVTEIGRQAFADCTGLKSLTYLGNSDLDRKDAFYDCPRLKKVTVLSTYRENIFCGKEAYKGYADLDKCDTDTSKIISK